MTRDSTKTSRYVHELDAARCAGNWESIPELIRKLKKHSPSRTCLIATAEAEHAISKASIARPNTARPQTAQPASNANASTDLRQHKSALDRAVSQEKTHAHDEFQARVCLGWMYWHLGDSSSALATIPQNVEQEYARLEGTEAEPSNWSRICAIKAVYIQGTAQSRSGNSSDALRTLESALPILGHDTNRTAGKEERIWSELYLSSFCALSTRAVRSHPSNLLETEALSAFRAWAKLWDGPGANSGGHISSAEWSRRTIWREYYSLLSTILEKDLPYPTTLFVTAYSNLSTRSQQRSELKRVESRYEALILSEVRFPKAEESSEEVETFVDLVMQNWRILCGAHWQESDLGDGGSESSSRGVLDILYRAATKTFHSTSLLRHLFATHLAVAEFDLAFKAFDTYMEIVKKGKARVEKTGTPEEGLDSDENVLRTASEYIKALCRFGKWEEAKKAKDIAQFFQTWLEKHHPSSPADGADSKQEVSRDSKATNVSQRVFALIWRNIGVAYAQWARLTFDGSARPDMQLKAIRCLRKSLSEEYKCSDDVETLFALGTILAERRELSSAIAVVKKGLLPKASLDYSTGLGPYAGRYARERALIPLWHLLALLLSARQEFLTAARSCEAAFEQFKDPKILFGAEELSGAYRSEHLNEKNGAHNQGIVDDMDDFEKENVLEVKITQLSLIEVLEGPDVAVNASDELLSLYSRLFGEPHENLRHEQQSDRKSTATGPRISTGTARSNKGSIFGRKSRSIRNSHMGSVHEELPSHIRPQTTQAVAPKIQVTNENGSTSKHHHSKEHRHLEIIHGKESLKKKKSNTSLHNRSASPKRTASPSRSPTVVDGEKFFTPTLGTQESWQHVSKEDAGVGIAVSGDNSAIDAAKHSTDSDLRQPHPPHTQQLDHSEPTLQNYEKQDTRLPTPYGSSDHSPVTRFPKDQRSRRRTTLLVKVWLLIAGFYRRATLLEDARGAIEEAAKLVQKMDVDVSQEINPDVTVESSGMGGGRTVNELWGDVYSERGYLASTASAHFKALAYYESALSNDADHPSATVGLANILLDIFSEEIVPPSTTPQLVLPGSQLTPNSSTINTGASQYSTNNASNTTLGRGRETARLGPLGIATRPIHTPSEAKTQESSETTKATNPAQPETNTTISKKTQRLDRLAARDRAYGLLSNLTKLGSGWNYSEAWFALAKAYELGGQEVKATEVLWWCVELEEARAVRGWIESFGGGNGGGYVL